MTESVDILIPAILGLGAISVIGLFVAFCYQMVLFFLHPKRPKREIANGFWAGCEAIGTPEELTLRTTDRHTLKALWFPNPHADGSAMVLCHGSTSYKEELLPLACEVFDEGFSVLMFDFRGHGESSGDASTIGLEEIADLEAALAWVLRQPGIQPERVGLLGHSMGAATIINYLAHHDDETTFAILLAPFATIIRALYNRLQRLPIPTNPAKLLMIQISRKELERDIFHNAPLNVIGSIRRTQICLIHGKLDRGNNPQDSQDLFDQAKVPKELHWIENGDHHGLLKHPEVWRIVREYVRRQRQSWSTTSGRAPAVRRTTSQTAPA